MSTPIYNNHPWAEINYVIERWPWVLERGIQWMRFATFSKVLSSDNKKVATLQ